MDTNTILSRLSIPGIALLTLGCALNLLASKMEKERITAIRLIGLAFALLGTLILLDFIPGL